MLFYRVIRFDGDALPTWEGTLTDAHATLKRHEGMPEARIELFDVPTDKAGVLYLLNNSADSEYLSSTCGVERTWCLTPRKGLKEVPNGE